MQEMEIKLREGGKQNVSLVKSFFLPVLVHFPLFPTRRLVFQPDLIRLGSYEPWFPPLRHQLFHGTVSPSTTETKSM